MRAGVLAALALATWPMSVRGDSSAPAPPTNPRRSCAEVLAELPTQLRALDPRFVVAPPQSVKQAATQLVGRDSHDVSWEVTSEPEQLEIYEREFTSLPIADLAVSNVIINRGRTAAGRTIRVVARYGAAIEPRWPEVSPRVRRILETIERAFDACQAPPAMLRSVARCAEALERVVESAGPFGRTHQLRLRRNGLLLLHYAPELQVHVFAGGSEDDGPALGWYFERIIDKAYSPDKVRLTGYFYVEDPEISLGLVSVRITAQGPEDEPRAPPIPPRLRPLVEAIQRAIDGCLAAKSGVHSEKRR